MDSDSDSDFESRIIRSRDIEWENPAGESFVFSCVYSRHFESDAKCINVKAKHNPKNGNQECVGYLDGVVLERPSACFYEIADEISGDLLSLACFFCEPNGEATRVLHPDLQERSVNAVVGGGFLQIDTVEVRPRFRGQDLGLRMVHEALAFLGRDWTLAVMITGLMNKSCMKWGNEIPAIEYENDSRRDGAFRESMLKLQRHFARMGFKQASRTASDYLKWFVTKEMYFGPDRTVISQNTANAAASRWVSKEDASARVVDVFMPPPLHRSTALDKQLREAITGSNVDLDRITQLLNQGASIDGARAVHCAVSNPHRSPNGDGENLVLSRLIELGANVNFSDEFGNRPLHVAAEQLNTIDIQALVNAGADRTSRNQDGKSALECALTRVHDLRDFVVGMGVARMPIVEHEITSQFDTLTMLITDDERSSLIDGWMSPRMRKLLLITAELTVEEHRCLEYIPPNLLRNVRSLRVFAQDFKACFRGIAELLRQQRSPTVRSVEGHMSRRSPFRNEFDRFVREGGKVEYAIDALVNITRNAFLDGEEYDAFSDEILSLRPSPFDSLFDIAILMLINRGGGNLTSRGPFDDSRRLIVNGV